MADIHSETLEHVEEPDDQEDWDDEDWDDEEDDGDDDLKAEAQEITRRLGAELWANLSKINASQAVTPSVPPATTTPPSVAVGPNTNNATSSSRKVEAIIITIRAILAFAEVDPLVRSTLESTLIPDSNGSNVWETFNQAVASGTVPRSIAMSLSHIMVSLAKSEVLFGTLRHSNASSIQLDKGKRKREGADEGTYLNDPRANKRPYVPESDLHNQVTEAVHVIAHAFGSSPTQSLDPSLVSSIRLQLHKVFLFAVTSSAGGGRDMHALQEISGLIQVIGVLSGIQIGQIPDSHLHHPYTSPPKLTYPWLPSQPSATSTDIGTAVYPCLVTGCRKIFSRLYSLRAHQRVHAMHRPYRCNICPGSFVRNHDLKRHIKLHEKKAWKCGGCHKIFSRRDAIKRHKNGGKARGLRSEACLEAEVVEVDLDEGKGDESSREERRAKLWSGITTGQGGAVVSPSHPGRHDNLHMEEGEIQPTVISSIQSVIMSLHGPLQAHVGNALGSPVGQTVLQPLDAMGSQATLASVIARAQLQNMPPTIDATSPTPNSSSTRSPGDRISEQIDIDADGSTVSTSIPTLSMYGLSDEQTKMLEEAIANAASAAQAQAEAEAALEEQDEDEDDYDESDEHLDPEQPN